MVLDFSSIINHRDGVNYSNGVSNGWCTSEGMVLRKKWEKLRKDSRYWLTRNFSRISIMLKEIDSNAHAYVLENINLVEERLFLLTAPK